MFSSDKNVESLAHLIEVLKNYFELQKDYLKLNVIDKIVRIVTALALTFVFVILGIGVLIYLSFAFIFWISPVIGTAWACFLTAMLFLALLILVFTFRKPWIERPLVRFLANTLLS